MEKETMFALTYCYEGGTCSTINPYGATLAVSNDIKKLQDEMAKCVAEDCVEPECEAEQWDDDKNFMVESSGENFATLRHRKDDGLYAEYNIKQVVVL